MSNKNILVIDDSKTSYASSGKEGVEYAKQHKPCCILMDVVMPDMNGFQTTRAISRQVETADIPILMLSSKSQKTDKVWAERQGAIDYIVKPADPQKLISKLKAILG